MEQCLAAHLLGMDQLTVDGDLQITAPAGSRLAGLKMHRFAAINNSITHEVDGHSLELIIQLLLQLIRLRLVPSSTTISEQTAI